MKIAIIIVRILLGLLLVFASVAYFFDLVEPPEMEGDLLLFNRGIDAAGYLLPLVKTLELLCGLAFLSGFFVPLATVVIFPVAVNILGFHLFLDPAGLPVALFLVGGLLFLACACRRHYTLLFSPKIQNPQGGTREFSKV